MAIHHIGTGKKMARRTKSQIAAGILLSLAFAASLGLLAARPEAGELRNIWLAVNWLLWALFVVLFPIATLRSGMVTGTQPASISYRKISAKRFWVGFVMMMIFWIAVLILVTAITWLAWYSHIDI